MEGWVLRPEQEGQDSSGAGAQGVTHDHQAVVHGALVLPERHRRHSRGPTTAAAAACGEPSRLPSLSRRLATGSFPSPVSS